MPIRAFVLVTTKPGTSEEIVRARKIRGVKIANSVFGRFDAVIMVEAKDMRELSKIVYEMIEKIPNIISTETLISLFYPPE
ncbi:MAG: Lrp/AsnC ligand binding domain-containing protein [archaeon]|nr:Lrp/AsnC ligand binding domain-containing protein [archaeon]MCP8317664.1 Lrp/AsnC ligand binding domain-containing protein [archaeon]